MNNAHLHLILNHLPITFVILGFIVMVGGFLFRSEIVKRLAYIIFIIGAIIGLYTFYTGENAQQLLEGIKEIDNRVISTHQQIALVFLAFLYILGLFSLIGLIVNWKKKSYSKIIALITILFSFVVLYYGIQTGTTGGEIRHLEIIDLNNSK
ncbi:MAG: hypothetical protein HQ521_09120 [Bacteroidetes bacterium]|nr:hypothetical protein [Bacteroidota bacterium]